MRAGEARVALEERVWKLRRWLEDAAPAETGSGNAEADYDIMSRLVHRRMMACIEPSRNALLEVRQAAPRLRLMDLPTLGLRYLVRRREHGVRVSVAREEMERAVQTYGAGGALYEEAIRKGADAIRSREAHAREVARATAALERGEAILQDVADVPAMTAMRMVPGQDADEALLSHAREWRGRVVRKGVLDALVRAFPGAAGNAPIQDDGAESALLRSHPLYADMFCSAMEEMRKHPQARREPDEAARHVRRLVVGAIASGDDPMDALVHGIRMANGHDVSSMGDHPAPVPAL